MAFTGYGSVFGELDSYRDIVMRGAFTQSLKEDFTDKNRKVPMLWQHNSWAPIGVYIDIHEDAKVFSSKASATWKSSRARNATP